MLRHSIRITTQDLAKDAKMTIYASVESSYSDRTKEEEKTISAIGTLLKVMCSFKDGQDFTVETGYERNKVNVNGKSNIIIVLNILLINTSTFSISQWNHNEAFNTLISLLISSIGNDVLMPVESEKLKPILCAYLDEAYQRIIKDDFMKTAVGANADAPIDEDYKGNILKHPLFQALSIMMDYNEIRYKKYQQKGFFGQVAGANKHGEEQKAYTEVYNSFRIYVPAYYTTKSWDTVTIDATKIRQSRLKVTQQSGQVIAAVAKPARF